MSKPKKDETNPFSKLQTIRDKLPPSPGSVEAHKPVWTPPKKGAPAKPASRPAQRPAEPQEAQPSSSDDGDLFCMAMEGVAPLSAKGRDLPATPEEGPPPPTSSAVDEEEDARAQLADFLDGKVEFALEHSEEYLHGHVVGLDSKIFRQLKAGQLSVEAHLDLHGLNAEQAYVTLLDFMRASYISGKRTVLLVPGRGKNSPGGVGVLRTELHSWLTRDPLKRVVLAFCTAQPRHGGPGAIYALLRKYKKSQGKIVWERIGEL